MIIPIRCYNCGNTLSDKWRTYQRLVAEYRKRSGQTGILYLDTKTIPVTAEGQALNELGLTRLCCRSKMLTHVDLIDKI
jgi:DNA-directed RNA polymerase I, II, and III subunit RPABC5